MELIKRKKAQKIAKQDGKTFYYLEFGSEAHGRKSFIVWISNKLINEEDECIYYPLRGTLLKTEKNNLVIKPDENYYIFEVYERCGFRGRSKIEIISPSDAAMLKYYIYSSPIGNLGISEGALIITKSFPIKIRSEKSGRLYGDIPEKVYVITLENQYLKKITIDPGLEDVENIL